VTINGEKQLIAEGTTVATILKERNQRPEIMAVEINGELLPKRKYEVQTLNNGDEMEFLPYMSGGSQ
jgi:thiamine biosynthesis protein ThiS